MTASTFAICTNFMAKDGISGIFSKMSGGADKFGTKTASGMNKAKLAVMGIKTACIGVVGALTSLAAAIPLKAFADWEKGITSVYTLMNKNEINKYGAEIKSLSEEAIKMGFAVEDANKGLFDTVSALGASEKSLDLYRRSMVLARGGNTELGIAIDGMTSVVNAYGRETTDAAKVAEAFYTSQQYGKTTVAELASNIGKIAPVAKSAGIGFEELLATMSTLTLGGLKTDEAATSLKGAISALIKPTKEAEEVLSKLGVPYGTLQIQQKGLRFTLEKLNEASKKHPELMAKAIPNIRAYTAVMALSGDKLKIIDQIMGDIPKNMKSGNGLLSAFDEMNKTASVTMDQVKGQFEDAKIKLGETLAPYLLPLVKTFGQMVQVLAELSGKITPVFDAFVKLGNAIGNCYKWLKQHWVPITITASAVMGAMLAANINAVTWSLLCFSIEVGNSIKVLIVQRAAAMANTAAWNILGLVLDKTKLKMMLLGGVWGLVIAGLILGAIWVVKHWDTIKEKTEKVLNFITEKWHEFTDNWKLGASIIKNAFLDKINALKLGIQKSFTVISQIIKNHFIDILLAALGPIGLIISAIRNMPRILAALGIKTNAFKITPGGGSADNPKVKGKNKGSIDVDINLSNKTDKNADVKMALKSPHDMQLNPK